jgi:hypothetical protein
MHKPMHCVMHYLSMCIAVMGLIIDTSPVQRFELRFLLPARYDRENFDLIFG